MEICISHETLLITVTQSCGFMESSCYYQVRYGYNTYCASPLYISKGNELHVRSSILKLLYSIVTPWPNCRQLCDYGWTSGFQLQRGYLSTDRWIIIWINATIALAHFRNYPFSSMYHIKAPTFGHMGHISMLYMVYGRMFRVLDWKILRQTQKGLSSDVTTLLADATLTNRSFYTVERHSLLYRSAVKLPFVLKTNSNVIYCTSQPLRDNNDYSFWATVSRISNTLKLEN